MNADDIRQQAEALESALGDPWQEALPTSYTSALRHDERETFPQAGWDALLALGYFSNFIPITEGGRLRRFDALLQLGRVVCRRDVTLGVAAGQCLLASLPVWIGGDPAQRARVAALLRGGGAGGLALTEQDHGSDLAATQLRAAPRTQGGEAGYALDGEKWCINNATRGAFVTALARSSADGGPRGFSLFVVDKSRVTAGLTPLPRLATHGVRAADISGVRFDDVWVNADARLGRDGAGLPLVLQTMQVSRTLCSAFSLGAADSALRLATSFALERELYGAPIVELAPVRALLSRAYRRLLLADAIAHVGARALSVMPEQMSMLSAVVKVAAPRLATDAIADCATVLGGRHYLREGRYAHFQKLMRDAALIALFDGSAEVNRHILAGQLARVANARDAERATRGEEARAAVRRVVALDDAVPDMNWGALRTSNRGRDDLLTVLLLRADAAAAGPAAEPGDLAGPNRIALADVAQHVRALDAAARAAGANNDTAALAALTEPYVWLSVAASVLHLAAVSPRCAGGTLRQPWALVRDALALAGLQSPLAGALGGSGSTAPRDEEAAPATPDALLPELLAQHRAQLSFGLNPFALAGP